MRWMSERQQRSFQYGDRCGDRCPEDDPEGEKSTADRADRCRYKRRYRCDRFFLMMKRSEAG